MITRRLLGLLLLAAAPLMASQYAPWLVYLAVGYLALIVGLVVSDHALSPRPGEFRLQRQHDTRLSLGAWNPIGLTVHSRARRTVQVQLRDEPPDSFAVDARVLRTETRPLEEARVAYRVRPPRRGDYQFGDLNLRWVGVLGLIVRQARYPAAAAVKVYPNLLDLRTYDLLLQRGRVHELGLRHSRQFGEGTEFERLREYQSDDEYRRVNWKATARRGRPISIEYETERSQNIVAALDVGRLMGSPVGELAKLDYAINTVLMLAYVAMRRGDRVGLLTFADGVQAFLAPRQGKGQFHRMLELLYRVESHPVEPNYGAALSFLAAKQKKRALMLCFTDLTGGAGAADLVRGLASLHPAHLPVGIVISDPGILELAQQRPAGPAAAYERTVAERLLEERRLALDRLRQRGGLALDVPADRLTVSVINQYLELKAKTML